jgi:hypothetical protein
LFSLVLKDLIQVCMDCNIINMLNTPKYSSLVSVMSLNLKLIHPSTYPSIHCRLSISAYVSPNNSKAKLSYLFPKSCSSCQFPYFSKPISHYPTAETCVSLLPPTSPSTPIFNHQFLSGIGNRVRIILYLCLTVP